MSHWIGRTASLRVVWILAPFALAMVSCTPSDESDSEPQVESEVVLETEKSLPPERSEDDEIAAATHRERIELMTSDAKESVVRAADFLAEQRSFRVVADIAFDVMQSDGRLLEFGSRREITIRRPDRLRIDSTEREGAEKTLYFDGSTISIDLQEHLAFVREPMNGTYYAALRKLSEELDAPVPLANLFSENFAAPLDDQIASGYFVGQEEIDGRPCEHLSFRLPEVDVQLWIEEGDRPLVARVAITHKHEDGNPQFRATLHDWDLGLETPETLFQFVPAEGTERLAVGSVIDAQISDRLEAVE
jgi:hypothetical protein